VTEQALGAARVRELLRRYGVRPSKSLGQNFVVDPNTTRKIVALSGVGPDDAVVEIGAGLGSLTLPLAAAAKTVAALEADERLIPALRETVGPRANVTIVHADARRADIASFGASRLVANLPYNLAAELVVDVLQGAPEIEGLTVMTQREVAERIVASPGSKVYGQLSLIVAYYATAHQVMRVSRNVFYPMPGVDSAVVRIERRAVPPVAAGPFLEVVKEAFSQRRKTVRNSLSGLAGSGAAAHRALVSAGVDPDARAEQLGIDQYVSLTAALRP
jgi:16S rRNA (adenine1518-N6/adenine1519-N6)-dimethyltransferase